MNFSISGISPEQADHYIAAFDFVNTFRKFLSDPPCGDSVLPSPQIIDSFSNLSSADSKNVESK